MKCKAKDNKIYNITWKMYQDAYLPAVTVCTQQLFNLQKVILPIPGPTCEENETLCDEICVDTHTDRDNCGDCGVQCSGSQECVDGVCTDILTATHVNDSQSFTEDTPLNFIPIVINQINNQDVALVFTLSDPNAGSLNTATSGSVTSTYNDEFGIWQAIGNVEDLNILLSNLTFTPALNYNNNFEIAISINDGDDNIIIGLKDMIGVAINDAPIATNLSAAESYTEDTALNLTNIVISDVDGSSVTATLTLSNTSAGTLNSATSGSTTSTYNAGTGVWTANGPISEVNTLLAGVTFTPEANFNSNFTITTSVSDGIDSVSGSKAMTGIAANDAPVLDNSRTPVLAGIAMDSGAPSGSVGTTISNLIDGVVPAGGLDNISDPDGVVAIGIAITAADSSNGTWYYTIGGSWNALGAVSNSSARLLASNVNTRIYFQPNPSFTGTINPAITFRAWDQTSGTNGGTADTSTNGGTTAFSSVTDTAAITVS